MARPNCCDQPPARTRQPRHHGPDWCPGHFGDLTVFESLHIAQHQGLAEFRRQGRYCGFEADRIGFLDQLGLGRCGGGLCKFSAALRLHAFLDAEIIDGNKRCIAVLRKPRIGGVTHDRQHPRPRIPAGKGLDGAESAQARLLHHVLRVGAIIGQPARDEQRVREMRNDDAFELGSVLLATHMPPGPS
jgi:hypothetical protein